MVHLLFGDLGHGRPGKSRRARFVFDGAICVDRRAVDKQHPRFFFQRHLAQKVLDTGFDGLAGILVDV